MVSLNKCTGTCDVLSTKICVPKETKDIIVKAFSMIKNKNKAKAMTEYISCDCKYKFYSTICNSNLKLNNKTCQCECKNFCTCKKDYSRNPSTSICENSKYLKEGSVTEWDKVITVIDIASTKETIATSATSTASNCHSIKVKDCYILRIVLLEVILLLIIIITCYAKQKCLI